MEIHKVYFKVNVGHSILQPEEVSFYSVLRFWSFYYLFGIVAALSPICICVCVYIVLPVDILPDEQKLTKRRRRRRERTSLSPAPYGIAGGPARRDAPQESPSGPKM